MDTTPELPQWLRELDETDNPVFAEFFHIPNGFPGPLPPLPPGGRVVWIGANDERDRLRAEVWVREPSGRIVAAVWLERRNKWRTWRTLTV